MTAGLAAPFLLTLLVQSAWLGSIDRRLRRLPIPGRIPVDREAAIAELERLGYTVFGGPEDRP